MSKYYFMQYDEERPYTLNDIRDIMASDGIKELKVFSAKRETGVDYFFCKEVGEIGETGECGKGCQDYKPRNKKSGICKHYGYCYSKTDNSQIIKI